MLIAYTGALGSGKGIASEITAGILKPSKIGSFAGLLREFTLKIYGLDYRNGSVDFNKTHDRVLKQTSWSTVFPNSKLSSLKYHIKDTFNLIDGSERYLAHILTDMLNDAGDITVREVLQIIGTDFARVHISETIWADLFHEKLQKAQSEGYHVIIDDCRFDNEALFVTQLGGLVIKLLRETDEFTGIDGHISESGVRLGLITHQIDNNGTIDQLEKNIRRILDREIY